MGFDCIFLVTLDCEFPVGSYFCFWRLTAEFIGVPALSLALCRLEHGYCFFIQVLGPNSTANSIMAAYQQKRMMTPVVQG